MTYDDPIESVARQAAGWRRDFHSHPEVGYQVQRTAGVVAEKLRAFGCDEVVEGIGRTGVVGLIRGRNGPGRTIGLRADMDALPMSEETNLPYSSRIPGKMHACGHDGHTAMLLGAAAHLAASRDFSGAAVVIFQPAEEGGNGALAMVEDGFLDRFGVEEVYGLHNMPGLPAGSFGLRHGAIMGAVDMFTIKIEGKGCHAAAPHMGTDPILVGCQMVTALQGIVARAVDPLEPAVVSVTEFHAGESFNVIPGSVHLRGTVRAIAPNIHRTVIENFHRIVRDTASAFGARVEIAYENLCLPTTNHPEQTNHAIAVAEAVAGAAGVDANVAPVMPGEDFSYMLAARPGAFAFIGNGDSANLHHPSYDFNDSIIPAGIRYWTGMVSRRCVPR